MNNLNSHKCLVLNADYKPMKIIDWQKSISCLFRNKTRPQIEIIKFYDDILITAPGNKRFRLPSVIRNIQWYNIYGFTRNIKLSNKNLFIRDDHTCQYCNKKLPYNQLTRDHIIPKSRLKYAINKNIWNSWENITTCCSQCNRKKANRTPEEANMVLKKKPTIPICKYEDIIKSVYLYNLDTIPEEWSLYINNYERVPSKNK